METEWLQSKGSRFLGEGERGLVLEGAPLKGLLCEETWEERGWLSPPPYCWDGACAQSAGVGAASLECCPPRGPAPNFRPGHLAHTWLLLVKLLLAARVWCEGWCELRGQLRGEAFWEHLLMRSSFPIRGEYCWEGVVRKGCAALSPASVLPVPVAVP